MDEEWSGIRSQKDSTFAGIYQLELGMTGSLRLTYRQEYMKCHSSRYHGSRKLAVLAWVSGPCSCKGRNFDSCS